MLQFNRPDRDGPEITGKEDDRRIFDVTTQYERHSNKHRQAPSLLIGWHVSDGYLDSICQKHGMHATRSTLTERHPAREAPTSSNIGQLIPDTRTECFDAIPIRWGLLSCKSRRCHGKTLGVYVFFTNCPRSR